jgi:alkylhydroperoxidase family enzyme
LLGAGAGSGLDARAAISDDDTIPRVPITREDMMRALEDSKRAAPRLPLPPLTEEERARAGEPVDFAKGRWGIVNNGRMRKHYLPAGVVMGGFLREPDPVMSLGYPFRTMLFWVVSRANNCIYCMGHQEAKLSSSGMTDDQIAALDGDWLGLDARTRSALDFTRKLTYEPHALVDTDFTTLREHFTEEQILEIILSVANFNAMNRWTGALRIPQEEHHNYKHAISAAFRNQASRVAPIPTGASSGGVEARRQDRRPLESEGSPDLALEAATKRTPRLSLASEQETRERLGYGTSQKSHEQWERLLARFPKAGPARIAMHRAAAAEGELDPRYKAIIAYVSARCDRAWYALGHARNHLRKLGWDEDAISRLDAQSAPLSEDEVASLAEAPEAQATDPLPVSRDRLVASFARQLTTEPARISDGTISRLRRAFSDKQVAEIVFQVTEAAFFDRLTEAAFLRLEE